MRNGGGPNLLFVLVDQMRYHAMGCAGNAQMQTPHLDRLAQEGVFFENAISNIPVCTPARACILTGKWPLSHTTLTNNSMLPPEMPSIAKMLKAHGYATGYIGKWHLAGEGFVGATQYNRGHAGYIPPGPMRHGFDYWAVHHCSHKYWDACYYRDDPEPIPIAGWEPDAQTDLAIQYLEAHAGKENPFALFVSWGTPHTPFTAPDEFVELYDPAKLELRPNVKMTDRFLQCDSPAPPGASPEEALRYFTANYYGAVSNIDHNLGRLSDALGRLGLADDTIVVFTSDHGEMLGSHGHMHKLQPWDESVRIPFLLRYPARVAPGARIDMPFNLPDILPTLLGLMGVRVPDCVEGQDFSAAITGRGDAPEQSAFLVWPCSALTWGKRWTDLADDSRRCPKGFMRPYRGVRTRTHTYVADRSGPWFLYDNEADPYQRNNLVETRGRTAVPPELERELARWLERTNDTFEDTAYYRDRIDPETGIMRRITGRDVQ